MANHSHLFRRGARYYFRLVVPECLRPIVGRREFHKALGTADYRTAVERLVSEEHVVRMILREARLRLDGSASAKPVETYQPRLADHPLAVPAPERAVPRVPTTRVRKKAAIQTPRAPDEITIGQLTEQYLEEIEKAGKAPKTIFQYQVSTRLLNDVFKPNRSACSLTRADAERFCTVLETMPSNAKKRYPGLSIEEAIEKAKKRGDHSCLEPNSRKGRFFAVYTIFKYGVETRQLRENPFDDRLLKQRFIPKDSDLREEDKRVSFTMEQLQQIFRAPLYTGCLNDRHGYAQPGPNIVKRGRFWVPLLALFHGMRENEICQLHTKDIGEWDGGLFIDISPGEEKRLKNKPSRRVIPVHPELLKMGFGKYVAERRAASLDSLRLFPELKPGKTGSFSDNFSRWFTNFLISVFGQKIKATFHSFRHTFVDACRNADLSPHRIDRICGWAGEGRQQREYGRARQVESLAGDIARIEYAGLDLAHLHRSQVQEIALATGTPNDAGSASES